jgi:hypothetical protein
MLFSPELGSVVIPCKFQKEELNIASLEKGAIN